MKPFKDLPYAAEILAGLKEYAKYIDVNKPAPENLKEFNEMYLQNNKITPSSEEEPASN